MTLQTQPADRSVRLPDGRRAQVLELGARGGATAVIALHGTPGSRLKFRAAHDAAAARDMRLVAVDRWGYGGTNLPAHPSLEGYGLDLAAIADALGIDRFGLIGVSGGGPFAAMAASRLEQRITRVALVCPVGPLAGHRPHGVSAFHRFCFSVLPRLPGSVRAVFGGYRILTKVAPEIAVRLALSRAPRADRTVLAVPERRMELAEAFAAGLVDSAKGPALDMALFCRPWAAGGAHTAPTRVWIGTEDRNVPLPAARRLAGQMRADIIERSGAGHYWIAQAWPEVVDWLSADGAART